jgi:hypothetical protein
MIITIDRVRAEVPVTIELIDSILDCRSTPCSASLHNTELGKSIETLNTRCAGIAAVKIIDLLILVTFIIQAYIREHAGYSIGRVGS